MILRLNKFQGSPERCKHIQYLAKDHWQKTRERFLEEQPICERCKKRLSRDVHHLHYDSIGHERRQDVLVICRECHAEIHGKAVEF